jgi:hypothetical protein
VFAWAGFDTDNPEVARARRAFLLYDAGNPEARGSYKLPFADVVGGRLTAISGALRAAASRLPQTTAPRDVLKRARSVLDGYFEKLEEQRDSKDVLCCDKLIEHLRTAEGFRQDGDNFIVEGVRRFDRLGTIVFDKEPAEGELKAVETPEGFLRVEGKIARTGVQQSTGNDGKTWREYRPAKEVFSPEAMDSFRLVIMTDGHPAEMVTIENVKDVLVGHGGEPENENDEFVKTTFLITDADAIRTAKNATAVELSAGYKADVLLEGGVSPDGDEYDAVQTRIRGNHVAKVDKGRCGPDCRLLMRGDATETTNDNPNEDNMKITINGKEHVVEEGSELHKQLTALAGEGGGGEGGEPTVTPGGDQDPEEEEEEEDKGEGQVTKVTTTKTIQNKGDSALQAKIDSQAEEIKELREGQNSRIDDRVELVERARAICPPTKDEKGNETPYDHRGKPDTQIMRDVILAVRPNLKDRIDAHKDDMGYLRASYQDALDRFEERVDSSNELQRVAHMTHRGQPRSESTQLNEVFQKHCDSLNGEEPEAAGEGK